MTFLKYGPAGGPGGGYFDDGENPWARNISSLQVFSGDTIDHLTVGYLIGTTPILPAQHGQSGGAPNPAFNIDVNSGERLTKVEGFVGIYDGTVEIKGLMFQTNSGRGSDLFGHRTDDHFSFEAPPHGEIYAFFGRQGLFVDALGVHVRMP